MPNFKCTHVFVSTDGRVGWSETMYLVAADITFAIADLAGLAFLRKGFLCGATLVGYRAVPADARGAKATSGSYTNFNPGISGPVNDYQNGALVNLVPTAGPTRRFFLRGLSDTMVSNSVFSPTTTWMQRFNDWANAAKALIKVRQKVLDDPGPVESIDGDGLVTTDAIGFLHDDDLVTFHLTRDTSGRLVTGNFRVKLPPAGTTTFLLRGWLVGREAGVGQWLRNTLAYRDVSTVGAPKLGERKYGRPFDLPRGLKRLVGRGLPRTG